MSSFVCSDCGAPHNDTHRGYVSSCECYEQEYCDSCLTDLAPMRGHPAWFRCPQCTHGDGTPIGGYCG